MQKISSLEAIQIRGRILHNFEQFRNFFADRSSIKAYTDLRMAHLDPSDPF